MTSEMSLGHTAMDTMALIGSDSGLYTLPVQITELYKLLDEYGLVRGEDVPATEFFAKRNVGIHCAIVELLYQEWAENDRRIPRLEALLVATIES